MVTQAVECRKFYRRTDEQNGLPLRPAKDDLVRRANTINVGWDIRDDEVTRINHAQIHVQRRPEMVSTGGPSACTLLRWVETPLGSNLCGCFILSSILLHALYLRLEPRIKHRDS